MADQATLDAIETASARQPDMAQFEESIVREEVRHISTLTLRIFQLGITLLVALETALGFLRKEWLVFLLNKHLLPEGTILLPRLAYAIGTAMLLVVALVFTIMCSMGVKRHRWYLGELTRVRISSIVELPPPKPWLQILLFAAFFFFPVLDVLVRLWVEGHVRIFY